MGCLGARLGKLFIPGESRSGRTVHSEGPVRLRCCVLQRRLGSVTWQISRLSGLGRLPGACWPTHYRTGGCIRRVSPRRPGLWSDAGRDTDLIEAAAWLHDIGYAPALAVTGFHPLDGARYLRDEEDAASAVCALVAHHSGAVAEAAERGLSGALLGEFPLNGHPGEQVIAITYCDFTTGPHGERLSPKERITEILSRYKSNSAVHRAVQSSAPRLLEQCREVTAALRARERG